MATEVDSIPRENMPLSQPAVYAATNIESDPLNSASHSIQISSDNNVSSDNNQRTDNNTSSGISSIKLPQFIVAPIELVLSGIGQIAAAATGLLGFSGDVATHRAKPWLEFFDLSAFKPAENGIKGYFERLGINAPYFAFNYVIVGLALTIVSVITKPIAIVGVLALLWIYFQFFGSEVRDGDYKFLGFSLNTPEKVGAMVFLGLIVFWLTAGGLEIFISLLTATLLVCLIHGAFRKPSHDALPQTSAV